MYWVFATTSTFLYQLTLDGWCSLYYSDRLFFQGYFLAPTVRWVDLRVQVKFKKKFHSWMVSNETVITTCTSGFPGSWGSHKLAGRCTTTTSRRVIWRRKPWSGGRVHSRLTVHYWAKLGRVQFHKYNMAGLKSGVGRSDRRFLCMKDYNGMSVKLLRKEYQTAEHKLVSLSCAIPISIKMLDPSALTNSHKVVRLRCLNLGLYRQGDFQYLANTNN